MLVLAEHDRTHRVLLEVQRQPEGITGEFQHLAVARVREPMDTGDAIGNRHDGADVAGLGDSLEVLDPLLDEIADLGCLDSHTISSFKKSVPTGPHEIE